MIVLTTTTDAQVIKVIPREYATSDISAKLTDDITGNVLTPTESTFTRVGDYLKSDVAYSSLKEDRFYTFTIEKSTGSVIYKDKVFVTNQTLDQVNNDLYTINENKYVEQETSNNDYIVVWAEENHNKVRLT